MALAREELHADRRFELLDARRDVGRNAMQLAAPPARCRLRARRCGRCAGRKAPWLRMLDSLIENMMFSINSVYVNDRGRPSMTHMRQVRIAPASTAVAVGMLGCVGLAAAMGIGRFAFTPLMPLMQAHAGLTLGAGRLARRRQLRAATWPARSAAALRPPPPERLPRARDSPASRSRRSRWALTADFPAWLLWRFVAGVASALRARGDLGLGAAAARASATARTGRTACSPASASASPSPAWSGSSSACGQRRRRTAGWCSARSATVVAALAWRPLAPTSRSRCAGRCAGRARRFDADAWRLDRLLRRLRLRLHHSGDVPAFARARG